MKTLLIAVLGVAVLGLPTSALANHDAPAKRHAHCKAEGGKGKHHSFRRCVRREVANAAKECKAERSDPAFAAAHDGKTFEEFYGTNANGRNAFGKCVSTTVREADEADDADKDEQSGEGTKPEEQHGHGHCDSNEDEEPEA
jgi:hypothetical protein